MGDIAARSSSFHAEIQQGAVIMTLRSIDSRSMMYSADGRQKMGNSRDGDSSAGTIAEESGEVAAT